MNQPFQSEPSPTLSENLKDISSHLFKMVRLEIDLFKAQIRDEVRERRKAGIIVGIGLLVGVVGVGITAAAMIHLLVDTTSFPLWLCEALTAIAFLLTGSIIVAVGSSDEFKLFIKREERARQVENVTRFPDPTIK